MVASWQVRGYQPPSYGLIKGLLTITVLEESPNDKASYFLGKRVACSGTNASFEMNNQGIVGCTPTNVPPWEISPI